MRNKHPPFEFFSCNNVFMDLVHSFPLGKGLLQSASALMLWLLAVSVYKSQNVNQVGPAAKSVGQLSLSSTKHLLIYREIQSHMADKKATFILK